MNVLLVYSSYNNTAEKHELDAVSYYRMVKPNYVLNKVYPDVEFVAINTLHSEEWIPDDFYQKFQLVIFKRGIAHYSVIPDIVSRLRKNGCKICIDTDDHWEVPKEHILWEEYKINEVSKSMIESYKEADFITCTTEYLADQLKQFGKPVYVLPNGIDTSDEVWKPYQSVTNRLRVGFLHGTTHVDDIAIVADSCKKILQGGLYNKVQLALGFNAKPNEASPYVIYEKILTDRLQSLRLLPEYTKFLKETTQIGNHVWRSAPYYRLWSVPVVDFGLMYNAIDISCAPLLDTPFNRCKSELKAIEAGFKGKGLIVSDVQPYKTICNNKNSFLLSEKSLYSHVKYIVENPEALKDKSKQLAEDVKRFDLFKLAKERKEVYEHWANML